MDTNITTYGDISPRTAAFAAVRLLKRGQVLMVTERFGQTDPQGKNKTDTRKYRRYHSLARATAPLAEGITPRGQKLTHTDVTVHLEQYGDLVELTDKILDMHEDPVLEESMDLCGEQAAETIEIVRLAVMKSGTNVYYAHGVTARASVNSPMVKGDLRKIKRAFKRNRAKEISKIIAPTPNVATQPVAPSYFVLGHTDLESDIQGITGFVPVENYADPSKALPGEIGKIEGFRFILTPMVEPWLAAGASGTTYLSSGEAPSGSAAADVYPLLFIAADSYAIVPFQGKNAVTPIVINPKPSPSDPLGQRGYVAWKTYQGCVILNHQWIARLEVAATANPS